MAVLKARAIYFFYIDGGSIRTKDSSRERCLLLPDGYFVFSV